MALECSRNSGRNSRLTHSQRGLTLVELMVALAISLFMVAGLVTLYVNNSAARTELDRSSRQIENGRFAIDMMRDDLALAGYYGEVAVRDVAQWNEVNPCATAAATLGWSTIAAPTPFQAATPVQGPTVANPTPQSWGCPTGDQRPNTGYLVVRRLVPVAIDAAASLAGTLYVQASGCIDNVQPFVLAEGGTAANFPLIAADCATRNPVRTYQPRLYYIADIDGVPTLRMGELVGNQLSWRTIADGIEDLQLEFGRDNDGDGAIDDFTAVATAADWPNVVAVRIRLISRSITTSPGYNDDKTYDRGALFAAYTPVEKQFKRRSYTALVQLPNVAGPRETP